MRAEALGHRSIYERFDGRRMHAFDPEQMVEYSLKPLCYLEKAAEKLAGDVLAPEGFHWSYRDGENSEGQEI